MKFKLSRMFNTKVTLKYFAVCVLFVLVMTSFEEHFGFTVSVAVFLTIYCVVACLFYCPSNFEINGSEITMRDARKRIHPKFTFVVIRGRKPFIRTRVTISKSTKIEYKSEWIERLFGVGRMTAYGRIEITRLNGEYFEDDGELVKSYTIYGIKRFRKSKEQIMQALPNAEHCEM